MGFHEIYRASLTQAFIIGILSFTQPGVWTALSNLGAGGLKTVTTAYTATSVTYGLMVILAPFTAFAMNRWGVKPVSFIGSLGYIFYSAGLYLNSKTGAQWLILLGAVTCGISSGPLWQTEALVAINYPEPHRRGLFIGIWQSLNKLGSIIAGGIMVSLNKNAKTSGKVSLSTYIFLLAIQATGPIWALLMSSPKDVIRTDGTKVPDNRNKDSMAVMWKKFCKIACRKEILTLAPLMLTNSWYKTWQGNYMVHNFSVRSRSLNVLLTASLSAIGDLFGAWILDYPGISNKVKARVSWVAFSLCFSFYFVWAFIAQGHIQDNNITNIDWKGSPYFKAGFIPFVVFKIPCELVFNWIWWVVGLYHYNAADMVYVIAVIRGLESLGGVLSYVVGVVESSDTVNLALSAGMFWVVIPFATYVAWNVPEHSDFENEEHLGELEVEETESDKAVDIEKGTEVVSAVHKVSSKETE